MEEATENAEWEGRRTEQTLTTGRHRLPLAARHPKAPPLATAGSAGADDNSGAQGRKGTGPWVQYVKFSWALMGPVQACPGGGAEGSSEDGGAQAARKEARGGRTAARGDR